MSIGELATKVVVEVKADTSDIKAKLKDLSGAEKEYAQAQLANADAHNKGIEKQIKGFQQLTIGLELTKMAGIDLGKIFKDVTGLSGGLAAAGFALAGPWGAAAGLAAEMGKNLLACLDTGAEIRAEQEKLLVAQRAQLKVTEDFREELEKAAIAARAVRDAADPTMGGVDKIFEDATKSYGDARDAIVSYRSAVEKLYADRVKGSPAKSYETAILRGDRDATTRFNLMAAGAPESVIDVKIKAAQQRDALADVRKAHSAGIITGKEYTDMLSGLGVKFDDTTAKAKANREEMALLASQVAKDRTDMLVARLEAEMQVARDQQSYDNVSGLLPRGGRGGADSTVDSALAGFYGKGGGYESRLADNKSAKTESKLAEMFGPVDEISGYTLAFDALSGAVGSAMSAWIDGSMSAGQAFKSFIAEAVKGIAIQMAMESLKHGAYAIGYLATGDMRGAALHATSAAKFAVGAVAASVAARALGGGGSAGVGGGASGGGVSSGAGGQQAGTTQVIAFGDSFADDSPRQRQLKAARTYAKIRGTSGVEYA